MHTYFMYTVGKTLIQTNLSFSRYTMSKIDLDRLIVRQTYFIPTKASKVKDTILKELVSIEGEIRTKQTHIPSWDLMEEHKYSAMYEYSFLYCYVEKEVSAVDTSSDEFEQLVEEKVLEFDKGYPSTIHDISDHLRSNLPARIYVSTIERRENGCICEVECLPMLYEKISTGLMTLEDVTDFAVQDALITCKRFTRSVFESGLSSSLIAEETKEIGKPVVELLTNNVSTRQITEKIETMLNSATGEILIFAWIGTILMKKLRELKEKEVEIKVITGNVKLVRQDLMRKEKELAMKELIQIIGKDNISIKPEFHGRAIIVDNKALIGSMDLDSYGLTGTRIEFATYTEDPEAVRNLRNYFNQIFTPLKE